MNDLTTGVGCGRLVAVETAGRSRLRLAGMMEVVENRDDLGVLVITADPIPDHFSR